MVILQTKWPNWQVWPNFDMALQIVKKVELSNNMTNSSQMSKYLVYKTYSQNDFYYRYSVFIVKFAM